MGNMGQMVQKEQKVSTLRIYLLPINVILVVKVAAERIVRSLDVKKVMTVVSTVRASRDRMAVMVVMVATAVMVVYCQTSR